MNKISKIGMSALCGSLAAISAASAGSLDVTGSSGSYLYIRKSMVLLEIQ